MKILQFLKEENKRSGREALITSIVNMIKTNKPSRGAVAGFLKKLETDDAFMTRIKAKARAVKNPGYIWGSIRKRTASHFISFVPEKSPVFSR